MRSIFVIVLAAMLSACADNKERNAFQEKLAARLATDPDLKDYNLDPKEVAECVTGEIAKTLPGFRGSPARKPYWEAYAAFESARTTEEALAAVKRYQTVFGSEKQASAAALGVTEYIMNCMGNMIEAAHPTPEAGN
ncbi:MAG: hypothetical protein N3A55_04530 [Methylohalobius sp.]|nr:hypothetical protein [Methylohalobius sp.]